MRNAKVYVSLAFIILMVQACAESPVTGERSFDPVEINTLVSSLPKFPQRAEQEPTQIAESTDQDEEYTYTVQTFEAAAGFDTHFALDPQSDVIYPGGLIQGNSINDGRYVPIVAGRRPITISASLQGVQGSVARTIQDPKVSTVREALNDLLNQEIVGEQPAMTAFTVENIYSESQFRLAVEASYTGGFSVSGSFDFSNTSVRTRIAARFIQSYFTVDMDPVATPADLFSESVDMSTLGENMPMYVATVTYGRLALFTLESQYTSSEVKAALEAAYLNASGSIAAEHQQILNSSTIKVYVRGGSGSGSVQAIEGYEGFKQYILDGGTYSKDSPGAPISYKLRYISDNAVGRIVLASTYTVRNAFPRDKEVTVSVTLDRIKFEEKSYDEVFSSGISIYGWVAWNNDHLFEVTRNEYLQWPFGTSTHDIKKTVSRTLTNPDNDLITLACDLYERDWSAGNDDDKFTPIEGNPVTILVSNLPEGVSYREIVLDYPHDDNVITLYLVIQKETVVQ